MVLHVAKLLLTYLHIFWNSAYTALMFSTKGQCMIPITAKTCRCICRSTIRVRRRDSSSCSRHQPMTGLGIAAPACSSCCHRVCRNQLLHCRLAVMLYSILHCSLCTDMTPLQFPLLLIHMLNTVMPCEETFAGLFWSVVIAQVQA